MHINMLKIAVHSLFWILQGKYAVYIKVTTLNIKALALGTLWDIVYI
jgi:hypothetical protein